MPVFCSCEIVEVGHVVLVVGHPLEADMAVGEPVRRTAETVRRVLIRPRWRLREVLKGLVSMKRHANFCFDL